MNIGNIKNKQCKTCSYNISGLCNDGVSDTFAETKDIPTLSRRPDLLYYCIKCVILQISKLFIFLIGT